MLRGAVAGCCMQTHPVEESLQQLGLEVVHVGESRGLFAACACLVASIRAEVGEQQSRISREPSWGAVKRVRAPPSTGCVLARRRVARVGEVGGSER
jgi:hypothetical protein